MYVHRIHMPGSFNEIKNRTKQNAIVRYAYKVNRRAHISGFVESFLGCAFSSFISLRNLLYFFRVIKNGQPTQLCSRFFFTHSTRKPQIVIPRIRVSFFERSFIVRVARCWNFLPIELRLFNHSNNAFRLKLLAHLLAHI